MFTLYILNFKEELNMFHELKDFDDEYKINVVEILLISYNFEKESFQERINYEEHIKELYPNEYENFLEYKNKVENRTPNLKEIYFDWLDGKIEDLNFDYFTPEGLDLSFMKVVL